MHTASNATIISGFQQIRLQAAHPKITRVVFTVYLSFLDKVIPLSAALHMVTKALYQSCRAASNSPVVRTFLMTISVTAFVRSFPPTSMFKTLSTGAHFSA